MPSLPRKNTGPKLDWTPPKPAEVRSAKGVQEFVEKNPENYAALNEMVKQLFEEKKWEEAKKPLQKLIELYPEQSKNGNAYALLARVHRELGEDDAELAMLNKVAERNSDAVDAFSRLMKIGAQR